MRNKRIARRRARLAVLAALPVLLPDAASAQTVADGRQSSPHWSRARATLALNEAKRPINGPAKNVILFVGDGMGPTTVTAARIHEGQRDGDRRPGVENVLGFETLPHLAMSKTYTTDAQIPDSAGTMTAMVTGVKTKAGLINYLPAARRGDCGTSADHRIVPLFGLAERAGLSTGVISTARLTHATPAATYAQSVDRDFEDDADLRGVPGASACKDIAAQLVDFPYGDGIDLAMGGGRRSFMHQSQVDPEDGGRMRGNRADRDLTAAWRAKSARHKVVHDLAGFRALRADDTVLGLFDRSHMAYDVDRRADRKGEPTLAEMTRFAIDRLSRDEDGYVLVIEAGRIDHGHHQNNAARALSEAVALDAAVEAALSKVDLSETLVIVTADHGHTLSMGGFATVDNDVLGLADHRDEGPGVRAEASDGKAYTTLGYQNGASSPFAQGVAAWRFDPALRNTKAKDYKQDAMVPLRKESHGGQDVTIYAGGPKAYLFDGTVEQNYVYHVVDAALDLERRAGRR